VALNLEKLNASQGKAGLSKNTRKIGTVVSVAERKKLVAENKA
jgi:hypothetical protein